MTPVKISALFTVPLLAAGLAVAAPHAQAASITSPTPFAVKVSSGPSAGEATITISPTASSGTTHTTEVKIETGLDQFSPFTKSLPVHGRDAHYFWPSWNGKAPLTFRFTSDRFTTVGAPPSGGNTVLFRVWTRNVTKAGTRERTDGVLYSINPKGTAPTGNTPISVGSFNVRFAGAVDSGHPDMADPKLDWTRTRAALVAQRISNVHPGIMLLQEAVPTAYYLSGGKPVAYSPSSGHETQIQSVVRLTNKDLSGTGVHYRATTTSYFAYIPATQQGMRILYDDTKYQMLPVSTPGGDCVTPADGVHMDPACSIKLPIFGTSGSTYRTDPKTGRADPSSATRWATYAHFEPVGGGKPFWVMSLHVDARLDTSNAHMKAYNQLRKDQVAYALSHLRTIMKDAGASGQPIILGGDFNDWQNDHFSNGWAYHEYLVQQGFYDTSAAVTNVGRAYGTTNSNYLAAEHYGATGRNPNGLGPRYDSIYYKDASVGSSRFENFYHQMGGKNPSDHNMVAARFSLDLH